MWAPSKPRAILHIGTEKTGTTTIQGALAAHRREITRHGFYYPNTPGQESHMALAAYAAPENCVDLLGGSFDPLVFEHAFAKEMKALPVNVHTVILSSEHCHSRVSNVDQVRRLQTLLAPHFCQVDVLVFLRRQDELACSAYSTSLRTGSASQGPLSDMIYEAAPSHDSGTADWHNYFNFEGLLDRYASVFGEQALCPRIFNRSSLLGQDVCIDFLNACGIPIHLIGHTEQTNQAISSDAQHFLALLNQYLEAEKHALIPEAIRNEILTILNKRFSGQPSLPDRQSALNFYQIFAAQNERVRSRWFPERTRLFSEDFRQYPESSTLPSAQKYRGALETAFACIADLVQQIQQNQASLHAFESSTSWKLTQPIRVVGQYLKARFPS